MQTKLVLTTAQQLTQTKTNQTNQTKAKQIKPNKIKSNQTNQIKQNQSNSNQTKQNQTRQIYLLTTTKDTCDVCLSAYSSTDHFKLICRVPRCLPKQKLGDFHCKISDRPATLGRVPYSRIWDPTIPHCLKQWIWPRTGLSGGCGRTALCNRELHVRSDDDAELRFLSLRQVSKHWRKYAYLLTTSSTLLQYY